MFTRESQKGESVRYSREVEGMYTSLVMIGGIVVMQEHYDRRHQHWIMRFWHWNEPAFEAGPCR